MDGLLDGFAGQNSKIDPSDLTSDDVGVSRAGNLATGPLAVTEVAQLSTIDNFADSYKATRDYWCGVGHDYIIWIRCVWSDSP